MKKAIQKVLKASVKGIAEEREEADAIIGVELGSFENGEIRNGEIDYLDSPSSRIVMGQPVHNGTGSFDVLLPVNA